MNEELAARYAVAIARCLGGPGRMIGFSKTGYREQHPDHLVVFNANVSFAGGKVWWGDLDLTLDEPNLVRLAAETGETVYVLYELDGRFQNEGTPLLERAVYSVVPSGHSRFAYAHVERRADGVLCLRPPEPRPRFRRPGRPHLWRFWRVQLRRERRTYALGRYDSTLIYLGRRGGAARSPLLVLGAHSWSRDACGGWLEWTWYPSGRRTWAPPIMCRLKWHRGRVRPYASIRIAPGVSHEVCVGIILGPIDQAWG